MFWYGDGVSGWGYALMSVSMVLFWVLVVAGAIALVRYAGRPHAGPGHGPVSHTALEVLAERFAHGEIDEDEYRRRRDVLSSPDARREPNEGSRSG